MYSLLYALDKDRETNIIKVNENGKKWFGAEKL